VRQCVALEIIIFLSDFLSKKKLKWVLFTPSLGGALSASSIELSYSLHRVVFVFVF
jgi:hypothetical protein